MDIRWIDQPDHLQSFCAELGDGPIAVDTESDHFQAYQAQVCLVQVGNADVCALVDPLALTGQEMEPLFELIDDPGVATLLHSARNDIRELDRDYAASFAGVFDTQVAAKFLGYPRNSLSWLQKEVVGRKPTGNYQRFDWTRRPVPDKARTYAAADVVDLMALRAQFLPELEAAGWLEAFRQYCSYIATITSYESTPFDPTGWWSVKGRKGLDGRARAALRELYRARHQICADENRAAVHIFPNDALIRVAQQRPETTGGLRQIKRLDGAIVDDHGGRMLSALKDAQHADDPPSKPPRSSRSADARPTGKHRDRLRALKRWRNDTADRLDIDTALIATNATLSEIAADPPAGIDGLDAFGPVLKWHRQMLGDQIMSVLDDVG